MGRIEVESAHLAVAPGLLVLDITSVFGVYLAKRSEFRCGGQQSHDKPSEGKNVRARGRVRGGDDTLWHIGAQILNRSCFPIPRQNLVPFVSWNLAMPLPTILHFCWRAASTRLCPDHPPFERRSRRQSLFGFSQSIKRKPCSLPSSTRVLDHQSFHR